MANEISLVTASGRTVTPKDDGIIYEVFSPGDGIIYGGAVTIKDSSTLHITAGHGIVCGRKFTIEDSDIPVALSGSGSLLGRLYIHLDLADAADPITLLVETGESLTPVVQDADVNINNGVYEINIATFDVDTSTISNLVDVAPYLNTNGYEHEQINNKLGNTDISGIGDGSVTGAISELNADISYYATEERCGTFLGSPLYRRTFSIGAITAGNSVTIPTDLSTNANVVKMEGVANVPDAGGVINIPLYISSSYSVTFDVRSNGSILVNTAGYSVTSGYITIYYTK